jgi:hypothetical protein
VRRKPHKDPVTPELHDYIVARDMGCVGRWLLMEGECDGRIEIDHILNGGVGKRGPSVPLNLVSLCSAHHRAKTNNARAWRPLLIEYCAHAEMAA